MDPVITDSDKIDTDDHVITLAVGENLPGFTLSSNRERNEAGQYNTRFGNKQRDFKGVFKDLNKMNFYNSSIYNDSNFERGFRMPWNIFET